MANHQSAIRQWRKSLRNRQTNRQNKTLLRTQVKKLRTAVQDKDKDTALKLLPETFSIIDRTVKKGAIHENTGNRYKSRLSRLVEGLNPAPSK